ncbi:hypothetical protein QYM36_009933, partial [Artemia franciscana]
MDQAKLNVKINPREKAGILSRMFFVWLNPLFKLGSTNDLELQDLYRVLPNDRSSALGNKLQEKWEEELKKSKLKKSKPSLSRVLAICFGGQFALCGIYVFIEECFTRVVQPLLLGFLIRCLEADQSCEPWVPYLYAAGIVFCSAFYTTTHHPYFFGVQHVGMKLRVSCCSLVYRKALKLSKAALGTATIGQMVNLLSNDVNRFDQSVLFIHYLWVAPLQTIITLGILWNELGPSCLAGLILLVLFVPFQGWIGKVFSKYRLETAGKTDQRIRLMGEVLTGMRVIKMYTWEKPFAALLGGARKKEVDVIRKTNYFRSLNQTLFYTSSKIVVFLTLLAYVLTGNALTADKVFLTISLYNNVRLGMTLFFPFGVSLFAEMNVSIKRIQKFLQLEERDESEVPVSPQRNSQPSLALEHVTAKWSSNTEENTLNDITISVKGNELLAIIGPVGSGKGSLLQAVLGELPINDGKIRVSGKVSYVGQEPWVFGGSIRQNILFGADYDNSRYKQVIRVCALDKDLSRLPFGDMTLVGDQGVVLSGGQKARVSLARALYMDADIYLLDDPLSAVDAHVSRVLFDEAIKGFLKNKLKVLVTHQIQYVKEADKILILKEGRIKGFGTYSEMSNSGIDLGQFLENKEAEEEDSEIETEDMNMFSDDTYSSVGKHSLRSLSGSISSQGMNSAKFAKNGSLIRNGSVKSVSDKQKDEPIVIQEMRTRGNITMATYKNYFLAGGGWIVMVLLVICNLITQVLFSGSEYWLTYWTNQEEYLANQRENESSISTVLMRDNSLGDSFAVIDNSTNGNLTLPGYFGTDQNTNVLIYTGLIVGLFIFSMTRTVAFFLVCMKSSVNLHNRMFRSVVRAPVRFFDTNPIGRTLNRFSKDIGSMDELLPMTIFDFYTIFLTVIGIFVLVGVVNPYLLIPPILLAVLFVYLRRYYLLTARDIKRLEGVARSPVFSHLSASLIGLTTVRAHRAQDAFTTEFDLHQDLHSSSWYLFLATTRWFGIWLDWLSVLYVASVTIGVMAMKDTLEGGDVGLAISSAMLMTGMFQWGVRQSAEMENQMTSVERVLEYSRLTPEAPLEIPEVKPRDSWPEKGVIEFNRIFLRYAESEPYVLRGLSCQIKSNEKIGIVGRTGAGKSTLISAMFRLAEFEGVISIDDVNIQDIGLHDLRSKISIIPQEPFLFSATVRKNLDPFDEFKDNDLWLALEEVNLKEAILDMNGKLDADVAEGGTNLSVGQRQLVCLARALLRKNKVLILDEATANVDPRTDELIQETIRTKFKECTVLTIAHRLNTIMDSDRIIVLEAGTLKEFDSPAILLQNPEGLFYSMVQQTGKGTAEVLIEMANVAEA